MYRNHGMFYKVLLNRVNLRYLDSKRRVLANLLGAQHILWVSGLHFLGFTEFDGSGFAQILTLFMHRVLSRRVVATKWRRQVAWGGYASYFQVICRLKASIVRVSNHHFVMLWILTLLTARKSRKSKALESALAAVLAIVKDYWRRDVPSEDSGDSRIKRWRVTHH